MQGRFFWLNALRSNLKRETRRIQKLAFWAGYGLRLENAPMAFHKDLPRFHWGEKDGMGGIVLFNPTRRKQSTQGFRRAIHDPEPDRDEKN
jgi:hypothetical protein